MIAKRIACLTILTSLQLLALAARADDYYFSPTDEHVRISLGVERVSNSTNFQANSSVGTTGTNIDGEGLLGLDKSDFEPKFQAVVRVATRHRLSFDYFTLDRTGNTLANETIYFRDVVFPAGTPGSPTPLQTKLNLRTFGLTYGYSFWHSETLEIAATLGVHSTDLSTTAKVETATKHIIQNDDQAGPVPTVGIDATWVASRRFYLDGRAQYLTVHLNNISGSVGFYSFDALYRWKPNISFALGYTEIRVHLDSAESSQAGRFDFSTKGPEAFFRVAF
jgi:hypothetical protein